MPWEADARSGGRGLHERRMDHSQHLGPGLGRQWDDASQKGLEPLLHRFLLVPAGRRSGAKPVLPRQRPSASGNGRPDQLLRGGGRRAARLWCFSNTIYCRYLMLRYGYLLYNGVAAKIILFQFA